MEDKDKLVEQLEYKQKTRLRKTLFFSILPIFSVIFFLIYTLKVISDERKEIVNLKKTKTSLKYFIDSIRSDSTTRFATSLRLAILNCDTVWQQKQLLNFDEITQEQSKDAHKMIVEIKKKSIPLHQITIRYYIKKKEKDKILQSLVLSGFSWVLIKEDSDDSDILCNSVHYSKNISEEAIKLAALSLIKAGAQVKQIASYSGKFSMKNNSIEIGSVSDKKLPTISVDSIERFKKF